MENDRARQQGTLPRIWARRGTRPRATRDTRFLWSCIFGADRPARSTAAGPVLPKVNTAAMNAHLAEIARTIAPCAHALLVLNGAGWHAAGVLAVDDNVPLRYLPPQAPPLDPVENLWDCPCANTLAITVFDNCEDIFDACCTAWNLFTNDQGRHHLNHLPQMDAGQMTGPAA